MESKFICPGCKGHCNKIETALLKMNNGSKGRLCYGCIHLFTRGYKNEFYLRKGQYLGQKTMGKAQDGNIVKQQSLFGKSFDTLQEYINFTNKLVSKM